MEAQDCTQPHCVDLKMQLDEKLFEPLNPIPDDIIEKNQPNYGKEDILVPHRLSHRAQRREKRKALWEDKKVKKKQEKKVKREKVKELGRIDSKSPVRELDMSESAVLKRRERTISKNESFLMASEEGVQVIIDCGFEDKMTEREKKSLSQQIMFSYGVNRRSLTPVRALITSLSGQTRDNLKKISGFDKWLSFKSTPMSYIDIFDKKSLVYLTADSTNTIARLERDKVYIIGGIVDRNRLKGVTYKKAIEEGIATAKLPLDTFFDMGCSTRVLTVNHGAVYAICAHLCNK